MWPEPITLESENVILEPLAKSHSGNLQESVEDGK